MAEYELKNAKIERTMLGVEDHGILTCMLTLNYGGSTQGFGGFSLDRYTGERGEGHREGTAYGMEFIRRILETVGVGRWEELPGTHCRVEASFGDVRRIGHIIEDRWFDPKNDLAVLSEKADAR